MAMATAVRHENQEPLTPQQMMQVASYEHAQPETDPTVLRVAAQVRKEHQRGGAELMRTRQLSWMASQHHLSEYNLMKNGPKGLSHHGSAAVTYQ